MLTKDFPKALETPIDLCHVTLIKGVISDHIFMLCCLETNHRFYLSVLKERGLPVTRRG